MILTEEMLVNTYETYVSKFIDGDTLDMNINLGFDTYVIRRIRLINIDAPEINSTKTGSEERRKGEVALYTLQEWFYNQTPPFYLQAEHKGLYGRWLGEIWREVVEESLNDYLISKGYYNSGWSWAVQKTLIEEWYASPNFHRYGKDNFLGNESAVTNKRS